MLGRAGATAAGLAGVAWCLPAPASHVPPLASALRLALRVPSAGTDAVALTFDDGPHPDATPQVLEILRERGHSATFFVVGEQVRRTGSLIEEIVAAGHTVAYHGDRHRNLLRLSPRAVREDLDRVADVIGALGSPLHRAPYGIYSVGALRIVRERGWVPLLWSRWGRDWRAQSTPASVAAEVTRDVVAGDVLLLHDADDYSAPGSWRTTVAALPRVLDRLESAGLRGVSVPV